jgi:hypothetical protein
LFERAPLGQPAEEVKVPHVRLAHVLDAHLEGVVVSIQHTHRQFSSSERRAVYRRMTGQSSITATSSYPSPLVPLIERFSARARVG